MSKTEERVVVKITAENQMCRNGKAYIPQLPVGTTQDIGAAWAHDLIKLGAAVKVTPEGKKK
jgi:hypothetical protein